LVQRPFDDAHWPASLQFIGEPHCVSRTQVPHVPWTHAAPPPHSRLDVQAPQTPPTQASPGAPATDAGPPKGLPKALIGLQSTYVEHGPQTPAVHT
jgi:hypothetical protein